MSLADLTRSFILNLHRKRVDAYVSSLCETCGDANRFKVAVRDFLIQLKEFEGDNAELYLEEKEQAASEKEAAAMRVPGLLKPSQIQDEEEL